jgi:Anti-sigma factor NepR
MRQSPKQPRKPALDRNTQELIGRQMRAMYSELVRQPLPEKLLSTLRAIPDADDSPSLNEPTARKAA